MARFEPYNYNIGLNPFFAQINQNPELINLDSPASTPSSFMLFSNGALVDADHNNSLFSPNLVHGKEFIVFLCGGKTAIFIFMFLDLMKLEIAGGSGTGRKGNKEESGSKRRRKRSEEEEAMNEEETHQKPKDVVHVRAKRGQATDSHSLAERVILQIHIYSKVQKSFTFLKFIFS